MATITQEKIDQTINILKEKNIDLWLTYVRETSCTRDPVMDYIYEDKQLTWQSAFIFTSQGDRIAIVGKGEAEAVATFNAYSEIIPYVESFDPVLLNTLQKLNPTKIAINYSKNDYRSDGLSHGLYELLLDALKGTTFLSRLCSAEPIIKALSGRKTEAEIARIKKAISVTEELFDKLISELRPGLSEKQISEMMHTEMKMRGIEPAWQFDGCPIVNAGPDSPIGHSIPSDIKIERGQLLHLDFGVKVDGYCSDLQRMIYFLASGEKDPPAPVQKAFDTLRQATESVVNNIRPGAIAKELDKISRDTLIQAGYEEYKFATGHQVGRLAHDGGTIIGPEWPRYGDTILNPLEEGQVYTVEPNLTLLGFGIVGLEEDVLVTKDGATYLSNPQTALICL